MEPSFQKLSDGLETMVESERHEHRPIRNTLFITGKKAGMGIMKLSLFLLLTLFGTQACSQQGKSGNLSKKNINQSGNISGRNNGSAGPDTVRLFPIERGTLKNYAYVLDGKTIEEGTLSDYANATLNKIFPYDTTLHDHLYSGALFFHTQRHPTHRVPYVDDPAWFINGTQVSPYDARWALPECYNKIEKSTRGTVIDGAWYKGSIHLDTDEDFFADRISLAELIEKHIGLPLEDIVVHWHSGTKEDVGRIIEDHFSIYHIKPAGLRAVKVDGIPFATGKKYVIRLTDRGYRRGDLVDKQGNLRTNRWTSGKAQLLFEDPLAIDTSCPCYVADVDTMNTSVFQFTELKPEPYPGEDVYLKKLSAIMGLSKGKPTAAAVPDSIMVQFIVTKAGC